MWCPLGNAKAKWFSKILQQNYTFIFIRANFTRQSFLPEKKHGPSLQ